jgi:acyl transferase domain-containing protein/thioesterase domain-containing protein
MPGSEIAVIGLSGRFPGAVDVRAFWKNVSSGLDAVRDFTDDELRAAGVTDDVLADPTYVKTCALLDGIEMFDAGFFGMTPRDAAIFDPQHRLLLECAWEAFEHGGYVGEVATGPVGVFVGCGMNEYLVKNVMTTPEVMSTVSEWLVRHGNDSNFLATRVSYELNLRGPSMNVQTACSSSLVAVHLACQSLLNGECDLALAGGSSVRPEQGKGYFWREGEIFSRDGRTRSFDANASGTALSSAVGCVLLKRLRDAERDGDNVLAVILGSAVNNDGRDKVGYLTPSVSGQARVVAEALEMAQVTPEQISYVEAHGSGTSAGDRIEITALTRAFRAGTDKRGYCALGSLKTNIGHAAEASGAAALIKTILALQNRVIPPSLHFNSPNSGCDLPSSPFFVNTTAKPWTATRRIAGVTSLGVGGTNCHVIVEEGPPPPPEKPSAGHQLLVISAKTSSALEAATENLARHLAEHPGVRLADVAFTLSAGRMAFSHRRSIVARDVREAEEAIRTKDLARVFTGESTGEPRRVAFLFPGEDATYAGMGSELYDTQGAFREAVDECVALLDTRLTSDVRAYLSPANRGASDPMLERPSVTLPALFAVEYALGKLLLAWGVAATAVIGHGAGEYAAACVAGLLSCADGLALAAARGRFLETHAPGGTMALDVGKPSRWAQSTKPPMRLVSTHTAQWISTADALDRDYWVEQARGPVRLDDGLRVLLEAGNCVLLEVGPGETLGRQVCHGSLRPRALATLCGSGGHGSELASVLIAVGRMWAAGEMEVKALHDGQARRRVPLPTYPWQRQRHWLMPSKSPTERATVTVTPAPRGHGAREWFDRPDIISSFVAARTPVERELTAMWCELLGVKQIGVRDDFFELGGQSLVAVRLFARIRSQYGVDLPLSTLLHAPTIEACATMLTTGSNAVRADGPGPELRSLVAIRPGSGRTPFVCVHGGGGNILNLHDLSRAMDAAQPFYGLQARGIDGVLRPHESIEEMATAYLAEIRAVRPHGPYMVGGYSGGGLVALEMARRLTAAGETVELLALLDTVHPDVPIRRMTFARRLERVRDSGVGYLGEALRGRLEQQTRLRRLAEADGYVARGETIPPVLREHYVERSFDRAAVLHRPGRWRGRAVLFRPEQIDPNYDDVLPGYGWERVIESVEIVRVPGSHASLLLGPNAAVLGKALGRAIDAARPGVGRRGAGAELNASSTI